MTQALVGPAGSMVVRLQQLFREKDVREMCAELEVSF